MINRYGLVSPGKRYWARTHRSQYVPLHWHDFYEFELIVEGTGTQNINSIEVPLCPGALTVVAPTDFHRIEPNTPQGLKILNLCIVPEELSEELVSFFNRYPPPYFILTDEMQKQKIAEGHAELQSLLAQESDIYDAIARRKIEVMFLETIALSAKNNLIQSHKQYSSTEFLPVIKYISEHYSEQLHRQQLADIVHMSPSYFGDQFKKRMGISVVDYITDVRLKMAHSLLKNTDEPIHNIITSVGFNSPSLFYRKFYEYYRIRPSDIAKKK